MNKTEIENIYNSYTNKNASEIIGVSVPTLIKMVTEMGIKRKGSGRPYFSKKEEPVYLSTKNRKIIENTGNLESYGIFIMLLCDKIFIENNWKGKSSLKISEWETEENDVIKSLELLYKNKYIGQYSIETGCIITEIINRSKYALTQDEYLKMNEGN